jgi:hypothetical protein
MKFESGKLSEWRHVENLSGLSAGSIVHRAIPRATKNSGTAVFDVER